MSIIEKWIDFITNLPKIFIDISYFLFEPVSNSLFFGDGPFKNIAKYVPNWLISSLNFTPIEFISISGVVLIITLKIAVLVFEFIPG